MGPYRSTTTAGRPAEISSALTPSRGVGRFAPPRNQAPRLYMCWLVLLRAHARATNFVKRRRRQTEPNTFGETRRDVFHAVAYTARTAHLKAWLLSSTHRNYTLSIQ